MLRLRFSDTKVGFLDFESRFIPVICLTANGPTFGLKVAVSNLVF
jgi:hypothetical protein